MRFLADMGVSIKTVAALRDRGHDVVHLLEQRLEKLPDAQVLAKAKDEERVVLTFDLDLNFGDLLAAHRLELPSVVIFRLSDQTAPSVNEKLLETLPEVADDLKAGAILIVEDTRFRLRRLPIQKD